MLNLPESLITKLNDQQPEVLDSLMKLQEAAKGMETPLNALTLSQEELYLLMCQFNLVTNASNSWIAAIREAHESHAELAQLCQQLTRVVQVENYNGDAVDFHLNPTMVQSVTIDVQPYSEYNDEGGYSTYYELSSITLSLDPDVAMAINPDVFISDGNEELDAEALKDFIEDLEVNICDAILPYLDLDWACYDGTPEITQHQLSMAGQAVPIGKLPPLFNAN